MSIRTWLRSLAPWFGAASVHNGHGSRGSGGSDSAPVHEEQSPLIRETVEAADEPPAAADALAEYRTALKALEDKSGAKYRSGMLEEAQAALERIPVPASLGAGTRLLQELFADCIDVIFRGFLVGGKRPALLLLLDGLVVDERLELHVLRPLTECREPEQLPGPDGLSRWLESVAVSLKQALPAKTIGQVVAAVLGGDAVLLVDGVDHAVTLSARGWPGRAIEEPVSEVSIRGPRDGFIETLRINTMLLRRRIRSPHLKIERIVVGRRTQTPVDLFFLKDVANPALVREVQSRIGRIDIDGVMDSGMLAEFIEDQPSSPFPLMMNTERPDRVVAGLLEGQVAVMVDGSPSALLMPAGLWHFMKASEDYYDRFWVGTLVLWLRFLFLMLSVLGPSLYIAITTFHQEMIPTSLLLSIAAAREGIPFPALVETLTMEVFFEALREAGIRLPRQVGQAVSIVGALVIGEAAVRAGLASAPVVIIVAATGIASFTVPQFQLGVTFRFLRFPIMILAGTLGLFGIMVGLIAILVHLCAVRSFGMPYLTPVAPLQVSGLKDALVRAPLWLMGRRPPGSESINPQRQAPGMRPGPRGGPS